MRLRWVTPLLFAGSLACSGSERAESSNAGPGDDTSETLPLIGAGGAAAPFAVFMDPTTGFTTSEVHDAEREVVRFAADVGALVAQASGEVVRGWSVSGAELGWSRSSVAFRVRFGTEAGARRAYFTEASTGTLCNLSVLGPDLLVISPTSERPPNP
jgi:hypothetical protein